MFARNLRNPRTAEPELDKKSFACLAMRLASSWNVVTKITAYCKEVALSASETGQLRKVGERSVLHVSGKQRIRTAM